jgi:hypothetical protein
MKTRPRTSRAKMPRTIKTRASRLMLKFTTHLLPPTGFSSGPGTPASHGRAEPGIQRTLAMRATDDSGLDRLHRSHLPVRQFQRSASSLRVVRWHSGREGHRVRIEAQQIRREQARLRPVGARSGGIRTASEPEQGSGSSVAGSGGGTVQVWSGEGPASRLCDGMEPLRHSAASE